MKSKYACLKCFVRYRFFITHWVTNKRNSNTGGRHSLGIANKKLLYAKCRMATGEPSATMFQFPSMMRWSLSSQQNKLWENLVCF